jgi:large subunit ribosomal protein L28e
MRFGTVQEAGNIVNKHSFKYSGIANEQAITIDAHEVNDKEFGVSLGIKTRAARKSPKKSTSTVGLTGGARKTMRSIKGYTTTTHYRKDLEKVRLPSHLAPCLGIISPAPSILRTRPWSHF